MLIILTKKCKNKNFVPPMRQCDMHPRGPSSLFEGVMLVICYSQCVPIKVPKGFLEFFQRALQVPNVFPKMFSIASHLYSICFAQSCFYSPI